MLKKSLFSLILFYSIGLLGLSAKVSPDSLPERYVPKVIIDAKWGSGPGEFGFKPDSEVPSEGIGPCGLTVSNKKIYILDAVNRRINVYSTKGKYVKAIELKGEKLKLIFFSDFTALEMDDKSNFYLLGYETIKGGSRILKYDSTGIFVKEIFKSPFSKDGITRIPLNCRLHIDGDTLVVRLSEGSELLYIQKDTGKIIKRIKEKEIKPSKLKKMFYSFSDYPKDVKEGNALSEETKNFVLFSRHSRQVLFANGFDKDGKFYELLWSPCKYHDMGVKVIKWEKVR